MLHKMRNIFRNKVRHSAAAAAGPARREDSHNSTPDTLFTDKAIVLGKRLYTVCKFKTSQTPSARSVESDSTLALSDHTTAADISLPPVDLGHDFKVPGCIAIDDTVAVSVASSEASTPILTPVASTRTDITECSILEREEVSDCTAAKSEHGLGKRLKAKYQTCSAKMLDAMVAHKLKVLVNVFGDAVDTRNAITTVQTQEIGVATTSIEKQEIGDATTSTEKQDIEDTVDEKDHEADDTDDEVDVEEDDDSDSVYDDGQPQAPRCDWKAIRAISDEQIKNLAQKHLAAEGDLQVTSRTCGTYHFVAFITSVDTTRPSKEWVIRIPAHGTASHWTPEDAYMLEREVQLVEHIRKNTKAPVSQIFAYSSDCNNELGSPFMLMSKLPGKSAYEVWFEGPYNPMYAFRTADVPSVSTEKKRINFLRSLARTMTEVQKLSFDRIGMPQISEDGQTISVGPSYTWLEENQDEAAERRASSTTRMYANVGLAKNFKVDPRAEQDTAYLRNAGIRKVLNIIFSQSVFNESSSGPESFTIHHNDLDLQNILVDEEGNVTGIIDWDKAFAAPRCIGAAAVPVFLRSDWFPRYTHDLWITPNMGWNEQYYREIYAAAMVEAGNPDAKYTSKSAMYQACIAALYKGQCGPGDGGDHNDLLEKLVRCIPDCRIVIDDPKIALGMGWPAAREMLERQFKDIFEPQLPRPGLLQDLGDELTFKGWWCAFDDYLDFVEDEELF
jgi:aminoglycoside phosphotransferase (APT) family kinase protein